MIKRMTLLLACVVVAAWPAAAQKAEPSADSLVAYWLRRGPLANWQPAALLKGCPNLAEWQKRGIDLVLRADLSRQLEDQLARNWGIVLSGCDDTRVENWLFTRVDAAMARGEHPWTLLPYWDALGSADSPGVRAYLRRLMLDTTKPDEYRNEAGGALFARFGPDELMREYLAAFETRRMPFEIQVGKTNLLLEREPERLLREVGRRVRENPDLAEQGAFLQLVASANRHASNASRRALADDIQEGQRRHPKNGRQLERLNSAVETLRRPRN